MDRRTFLGQGAAAGLLLGTRRPGRKRRPPGYPFTLGVASGDPLPGGVVLWTRLAPDPLNPDPAMPGGMWPYDTAVEWEIATDDRFGNVVRRGSATARPELAHTVHVEAGGLRPGREYFYRFRTAGEISPIGRTRTAAGRYAPRIRFAVASCQHYEHGLYTAYRHMAKEDLDVVVHLGDYIYEYGEGRKASPDGSVRRHGGPEVLDLAGYRLRHALYRLDLDLQAAHAAAPWIVTWDDHEVVNNYSGELSRRDGPAVFLRRRAAAYQAYYEHMPLRRSALPHGPDMRVHRRISYGGLADFWMLDTRQYRTAPPVDDGVARPAFDRADPSRSMLGADQERWLIGGLSGSVARWKIIAQQVFFARRNLAFGGGEACNPDSWDGFTASRDRMLRAIAERRITDPVLLTGDVHAAWANELKADFADPGSATLGVELVGTSISSGGDGSDVREDTATTLARNPHLKFFNGLRGYLRCELTDAGLRADYRVVPFVTAPGAPISTRAGFRVESGRPGLEQVADNPVPTARLFSPQTVEDGIEG